MHDLLHLAGARGSVIGLSSLLSVLVDAEAAFDLLGVAYPAVHPWTALLAQAGAVLQNLQALRDRPAAHAVAVTVARAFEASDDGLLGVTQKAGFVDLLAGAHDRQSAARLVRAAAYLAGVIRQATHTSIQDWEDAANPEAWLLTLVHDFTPLARRGVGADAATQAVNPLQALARECTDSRRAGESAADAPPARLPDALLMLAKLFKAGGTQQLGAQVRLHFERLAAHGAVRCAESGDKESHDADEADSGEDGVLEGEQDDEAEDAAGAALHAEPNAEGSTSGSTAQPGAAPRKLRAPGKRGDGSSNRLSERAILQEHHRAFDPAEQAELTGLIEQALSDPRRIYPGSRPARDGAYQLLIAAVARCVARTIATASRTRVVNYDRSADLTSQHLPRERCIFISHLETDGGKPLQVGYADDEGMSSEHLAAGWTLLPLPVALSDRLRRLAPDVLDAEVQELLPFVPVGWGEQAGQWLAKRFNRSIGDFNLANRHALARALFAQTANRALIDLACIDLRKASGKLVRQVALSSYLLPGTGRDKAEVLRAATGLISRTPWPNPTAAWQPEFTAVPAEVLQILGTVLRRKAEAAGSARDRHEAVALYTLLGLILCTGHRASNHIFHFPWDLNLEEAVAFLCDKLQVGSEARFIPLVRRVVSMVHTYRRHLVALIEELNGPRKALARAVAEATGLPAPGRRGKKQAEDEHKVGQFFLINGDEIQTISADDEEHLCRQALADEPEALLLLDQAPGSGSLLQRLRRNIATYLWTGGLSGALLEAFLGHNRKLHAFGAASTWSVKGDLVRVLPLVDRYLDTAQWRPLQLGADIDGIALPPVRLPLRGTGLQAYEGREREAVQARARARRAVRQVVLALGTHPDERITLDDDAVTALRNEAAATLGSDPAARDKLLQAFATLSAELKFEHGVTISAVTAATQDREPGPVDVGFARDLALAGAIRSGWPALVLAFLGDTRKDKPVPEEIWLAVIASSLVINDALLDSGQLWPVLESIHARRVQVAEGRVQVRASVTSPRSEFERVVYLSRVSTAAVVGLHRAHRTAPPPQRELDRQRIDAKIAELMAAVTGLPDGAVADLSTLAAVFRPWWFLRLPGVVYAVAIGERDSPSCDAVTEATLLGATPPQDAGQVTRLRAARRAPVLEEINRAGDLIKDILDKAEGEQLEGTQGSRHQRQELRQFFQNGIGGELSELTLAIPMAALRLDFIEHLLVHGGLEKEVLAFGSILAYDQRLAKPNGSYARWWQSDPREFSSAEFDATYAELLQAGKDDAGTAGSALPDSDHRALRTALRNFHAFLRQAERVPDAPVLGLQFSQARRRRPRSTILAPRLFDSSLEAVRQIAGDDAARAENATKLLTICRAYGARRKEALYSLAGDYRLRAGALSLMVQSNAANKLKNPANGTRLVPFGLGGEDADRFLRAAVDIGASRLDATQPVFADPTAEARLLDFGPIARTAIAALKVSAGNTRLNLHGERHGFGTRIGLAVVPSVGHVAPIRRIREELAVEPAVRQLLDNLGPRHRDWPFQIDRASMWHGNAGIDNYLDVYFHGGAWLLAEHADAHAIGGTMNPAHWAALMGMTRTNIVHLRRTWKASEEDGADLSDERVVGHFLDKLQLKDAATVESLTGPSTVSERPAATPAPTRLRLTLPIADRLLVRRYQEQWSLDELAYIAESESRLRRDEVEQFIEAYKGLVADTDLKDFEPEGGDLATDGRANRAGVVRSAPRRQAMLARLEDMQKELPGRDALRRLRDNWRQWVVPARPLLVCRQPDDLRQMLEVLTRLGFGRTELRLLVTPDWWSRFGELTFHGVVPERDRASRFSRGAAGVAIAEAGIEVVGRLEDALVHNADLHRAMMVFCACAS